VPRRVEGAISTVNQEVIFPIIRPHQSRRRTASSW
jgi:hypothetical protein